MKAFEPATLAGLNLSNRIVRSATWMGMAPSSGAITPELVNLYENYSMNEVGLIITGFTSICPWDPPLPGGAVLYSDSDIPGHRRLTDAIHSHNGKAVIQAAMNDAFVKTASGRVVIKDINNLTIPEIEAYINFFGDAAMRAERAGYDAIQIHAAHFFFLSRFISPAFNMRRDQYGGAAQNRSRILLEILANCKKKSKIPVITKINCSDFVPEGNTERDFLEIASNMAAAGYEAIEVSGNNTSRMGVKAGQNEGYFAPAAKALKELAKVPVILVGGLRSPAAIQGFLDAGVCDFAALSRPLIREPGLIRRWLSGDLSPARCISCNQCYHTPGHQCIFVLRGV